MLTRGLQPSQQKRAKEPGNITCSPPGVSSLSVTTDDALQNGTPATYTIFTN